MLRLWLTVRWMVGVVRLLLLLLQLLWLMQRSWFRVGFVGVQFRLLQLLLDLWLLLLLLYLLLLLLLLLLVLQL